MSDFIEIGSAIGELVAQKNEAYGSSFEKAGEFLRLLYPDGVRPEQYVDALLVVRIFDKLMRIATDRDALGESPYQDIAGYGILGVSLHHARAEAEAREPSAASAQATQSPLSWAQRNARYCCAACGKKLGDMKLSAIDGMPVRLPVVPGMPFIVCSESCLVRFGQSCLTREQGHGSECTYPNCPPNCKAKP